MVEEDSASSQRGLRFAGNAHLELPAAKVAPDHNGDRETSVNASAEDVLPRCISAVITGFAVFAMLVVLSALNPPLALLVLMSLVARWSRRARNPATRATQEGIVVMEQPKPKRLFIFPVLIACAALVLAIILNVRNADQALKFATWAWVGALVVGLGFSALWGWFNDDVEEDLRDRIREGSKTLIGVNGVVLALVYKYNEPTIPPAMKWGGMALLVSLALALAMYTVVSGKIAPFKAVVLSLGVFNATVFAFLYGLICIVFAVVWP